MDSKEFYAPIITPHEALLAFGSESQDPTEYRLDFGALLGKAHQGTAPAFGVCLPNSCHLSGADELEDARFAQRSEGNPFWYTISEVSARSVDAWSASTDMGQL